MSDVSLQVNGKRLCVAAGTTVASALMLAGEPCRISVTGEPRSALCGMGICYECRAMVNGIAHYRSCQLACAEGMVVTTQC